MFPELPLSEGDLEAISRSATAFCQHVANTANDEIWKSVSRESIPPRRTITLAAVYCSQLVFSEIVQGFISTFDSSLGPGLFALVTAIARALSTELERSLRPAPDGSALADYMAAQSRWIEAKAAGRQGEADHFEQVMNDLVKDVKARAIRGLPFDFSNHPMLGAALRELLTLQSRLAIGLTLLISGGLLPLLDAHLGSHQLILATIQSSLTLICLLGGSALAALGERWLGQHVQHASGGTRLIRDALMTNQFQTQKLQVARQLNDEQIAKLSDKETEKLRALLQVFEQRNGILEERIKLEESAARPAPQRGPGWEGLMRGVLDKATTALATYLALIPAIPQMGAISNALTHSPVLPINGTFDGSPGQIPDGLVPLSATVGLTVMACLFLVPPIKMVLNSGAGALIGLGRWALLGAGSPATGAAGGSSPTAESSGNPVQGAVDLFPKESSSST
jgi:hypothetical protein